jgi:hypothetical protein
MDDCPLWPQTKISQKNQNNGGYSFIAAIVLSIQEFI